MSRAPFAVVACLLPLAAAPAGAQQLDLSKGGPVQVNAAGGIDWRQDDQVVIAHGDARAIRGDVTVTADQLIAHYRKKPGTGSATLPTTITGTGTGGVGPPASPPAGPPSGKSAGAADPDATSGTEVYRLDAIGHVHIFTPTDQAWGDKAVYDMDQSVLVLTGHALRLLTPQDLLTARDSMEYWPQLHRAVARGNAVVVTNDGRRIAGDVLVAYTTPGADGTPTPGKTAAANPITPVAVIVPPPPTKPPADPLLASGKLQRVEAFGNVDVRTVTETVHGDRGVYVSDTDKARIVGNVHITRGQNQLNGSAADVNMKTGVASLLSGPQQRVQGLIVPNDAQSGVKSPGAKPARPAGKPANGGA